MSRAIAALGAHMTALRLAFSAEARQQTVRTIFLSKEISKWSFRKVMTCVLTDMPFRLSRTGKFWIKASTSTPMERSIYSHPRRSFRSTYPTHTSSTNINEHGNATKDVQPEKYIEDHKDEFHHDQRKSWTATIRRRRSSTRTKLPRGSFARQAYWQL